MTKESLTSLAIPCLHCFSTGQVNDEWNVGIFTECFVCNGLGYLEYQRTKETTHVPEVRLSSKEVSGTETVC